MASSYRGPATLVVDGRDIPVEADLYISGSGAFREWNGSVSTDDPVEDFHAAVSSDDVKLRLPDEREGDVVPTSTAVGTGTLELSGSGRPPF